MRQGSEARRIESDTTNVVMRKYSEGKVDGPVIVREHLEGAMAVRRELNGVMKGTPSTGNQTFALDTSIKGSSLPSQNVPPLTFC